jgi:phytoene/squalene synthetase
MRRTAPVTPADHPADDLHPVPHDPRYDAVAQASAAVVIDGYSTSFGWACRLLHRPVRGHVRNIYALVRLADEIVDGPLAAADQTRSARLLDDLERETYDAVETGYSTNLVVHAFAITARRFDLDHEHVRAFFASMRTDLTRSVHTADSLDEYIYGSAEVVGLMCLDVFLGAAGRTDVADLTPGARSLGAAFQKINFLRDLGADHDDLGRAYFPGVDLAAFTDADRDVLVADVRADLDRAATVIPRLPANSRVAVAAAHGLFAELTRRVAAVPAAELLTTRVRVPAPAKARIVAAALRSRGSSV